MHNPDCIDYLFICGGNRSPLVMLNLTFSVKLLRPVIIDACFVSFLAFKHWIFKLLQIPSSLSHKMMLFG